MLLHVTERPQLEAIRGGLPDDRQQGALHLGFTGPSTLQAVGVAGCGAGQTSYPLPGTFSQFSFQGWVTTLFLNPHLLCEFPLKPFHGSCGNTQTCRMRNR